MLAKQNFFASTTSSVCRLSLNGEILEKVNEFCYLGSVMSNDGGADKDVKAWISKAVRNFGMLFNIWRSPQISRNMKLKIFKSNVLFVLLYGCET